MGKPKCDNCGTTENVVDTIDPYAWELDNEEIDVTMCEDCLEDRKMQV